MFINIVPSSLSQTTAYTHTVEKALWQVLDKSPGALSVCEKQEFIAPKAVGQGAPQAINACVCVIVVTWAESADVGLWVAVCFLAKISLHRSTCKTTFARLTQSQAISQSFRVFISFRSMRDTTFFHFSKLFLIQNYRFLYHGDQKISWWTLQVAGSQLRNPPVKFRHER